MRINGTCDHITLRGFQPRDVLTRPGAAPHGEVLRSRQSEVVRNVSLTVRKCRNSRTASCGHCGDEPGLWETGREAERLKVGPGRARAWSFGFGSDWRLASRCPRREVGDHEPERGSRIPARGARSAARSRLSGPRCGLGTLRCRPDSGIPASGPRCRRSAPAIGTVPRGSAAVAGRGDRVPVASTKLAASRERVSPKRAHGGSSRCSRRAGSRR